MNENTEILVYSDAVTDAKCILMGTLKISLVRGKELFSFEYDDIYIKHSSAFQIDPNLILYSGEQYAPQNQQLFGIFLDSAPDRWGRILLQRKEAIFAKNEKRNQRKLTESDYLLRVFDEARMGALRFKKDGITSFLDNNPDSSIPPFTSLRALEQASLLIESSDETELNQESIEQLKMLIAPGSSLGGARPKASVKAPDGSLWIAKFPSSNDQVNQGLWEYLSYKLAILCGIEMADSRAESFYSNKHSFLTKRFDRLGNNQRVHFFSAMTLLGYQDGADASIGASYLELAELILSRSAEPEKDLNQLWRRIVFSILISNTDDHLRNHGFLIEKKGIRLSPAYDINPNPFGSGLSLNIDESDNRLDPNLALEVASYFRISDHEAIGYLNQFKDIISSWKKIAESIGIKRNEIERMNPAFNP